VKVLENPDHSALQFWKVRIPLVEDTKGVSWFDFKRRLLAVAFLFLLCFVLFYLLCTRKHSCGVLLLCCFYWIW
jgi:hypothetical protein